MIKNLIHLIMMLFILNSVTNATKTYASVELSFHLGPAFKKSIKDVGEDKDESTSLPWVSHINMLYDLIDTGFGHTSIGLRSQGYVSKIGNRWVQASALSLLVKQRIARLTDTYRGFFADILVGLNLIQVVVFDQRIKNVLKLYDSQFLGGFQAGSALGYKFSSQLAVRAELGYAVFSFEHSFKIKAPYITLGLAWFIDLPSNAYDNNSLEIINN